jgi:hypothetical protein
MTQAEQDGAYIVVVEAGAELATELLDEGLGQATERAMIPQQHDETPGELAVRAARRAKQIAAKQPVEICIIAAGEACDDEVFHSRCQIARTMILAMRGARAPRLVFAAPKSLSDEGRHELMAIVGTLTSQLHGTPVEVSVRFAPAESSPRSGVHRTARLRASSDEIAGVA